MSNIKSKGEYMSLKDGKLVGAETAKALKNFPRSGLPRYLVFYEALAQVKLACALTNSELGYLSPPIATALIAALKEMSSGKWFDSFLIEPLQGGAGTSVNLNINEIAAIRANQLLVDKGERPLCLSLEHVNLHQSTNDVFPTALKLAGLRQLQTLESAVNNLLKQLQILEQKFADVVKIGRTQLMSAVPCTLGREFGAYAEALGRDRWRLFKAQERIRQINLGGTAIGTGLAAPRHYIFRVSEILRELTGLPLARAENMMDATQNHDQLAEVMAILKILAIDLEKITNDLRLMVAFKEITLPVVQKGSSIMPGKTNPVILEMVSTVAKKVIGNEFTSSLVYSRGELELNAFLPLAAHLLLESLDILTQAVDLFDTKALRKLRANRQIARHNLFYDPASSAVLLPIIGYRRAENIAKYMSQTNCDIEQATQALEPEVITDLKKSLKPQALQALGY